MTIYTRLRRYIYTRILRWFKPKRYVYRKPKRIRIASSYYPEQRMSFNSYWQYVHEEACRQHAVSKPRQTSHTQAYPVIPAQNPVKQPKTT